MKDSCASLSLQRYQELLQSVHQIAAAEEELLPKRRLERGQLQELHALWHAGQLFQQGESQHHSMVNIRDFGQWNRDDGPDFLRVELEVDGEWMKGQAVFTEYAQDWTSLSHHQDEGYADVVLQLCLYPVPPDWISQTKNKRALVVISIQEQVWKQALALPRALDPSKLELCRTPLDMTPLPAVKQLLQAAASYRIARKRAQFETRAAALGRSQAWYEAWAESLGYYSNKKQMKTLARRAPLNELNEQNAPAILFGTAGFLQAVLHPKAEVEDRLYHRQTWDIWWPLQAEYQLHAGKKIDWNMAGQRPMNHPNRRVAALALTVQRWNEFESLLRADSIPLLEQFCKSLTHPYWNYHSALPSLASSRPAALVGKERLRAFLINHLLVNEDSPLAWQIYLKEKEKSIAGKMKTLAHHLCGARQDIQDLLPYCYVQQGILQLGIDFAAENNAFPQQLQQGLLES